MFHDLVLSARGLKLKAYDSWLMRSWRLQLTLCWGRIYEHKKRRGETSPKWGR